MPETLSRGLLLPFRAYFQPQRVFVESVTSPSRMTSFLVYLFSLIWLVVALAAGALAFGPPNQEDLLSVLLVPLMMAVLGALLGSRSQLHNNQTGESRYFFNAGLASAFGVYLGMMILLTLLLLQHISRQTGLDVALVVDSPTLDMPTIYIMGAGLGLTLGALVGGFGNPRPGLFIGFGATLLTIVTSLFAKAEMLSVDVLAFAGLLATHLVFQSVYVLIGAVSALLVEVDPGASRWLWKVSPARWCDMAYVPLPGLANLVLALHRHDPAEGSRAIDALKQHPFYAGTGLRLEAQVGGPTPS